MFEKKNKLFEHLFRMSIREKETKRCSINNLTPQKNQMDIHKFLVKIKFYTVLGVRVFDSK